MRAARVILALAAVTLAGCGTAHQPQATPPAASSAPWGASDVPPGWSTISTPDQQALAFNCSVPVSSTGVQQLVITIWNISTTPEQAWHLIVVDYNAAGQQLAALYDADDDIGDTWITPGQKLTFRRLLDYGPRPATCAVIGND
jgi:hypothetical protein